MLIIRWNRSIRRGWINPLPKQGAIQWQSTASKDRWWRATSSHKNRRVSKATVLAFISSLQITRVKCHNMPVPKLFLIRSEEQAAPEAVLSPPCEFSTPDCTKPSCSFQMTIVMKYCIFKCIFYRSRKCFSPSFFPLAQEHAFSLLAKAFSSWDV